MIEEIRAALLDGGSPEPDGARTHQRAEIQPGLQVRVRPFLYLPFPGSGSSSGLTPVRFAYTRRATVTDAYRGSGLVPVRFDDEDTARVANRAGYTPAELHRLHCTCPACPEPH
ncbi:hypothetical protein ABGB09_29625 [Streptomyces sp. B8F3]|uniref:hypothetical protein n=1 Tax=Streptomyces sp. B8F3 TaxID=3153573 RepID=UPI00325CF02D